jgi:hypothetical protein
MAIQVNKDSTLHQIREAAKDKLLSDLWTAIDVARPEVGYILTTVDVIGCIECTKLHYYTSMHIEKLEENL